MVAGACGVAAPRSTLCWLFSQGLRLRRKAGTEWVPSACQPRGRAASSRAYYTLPSGDHEIGDGVDLHDVSEGRRVAEVGDGPRLAEPSWSSMLYRSTFHFKSRREQAGLEARIKERLRYTRSPRLMPRPRFFEPQGMGDRRERVKAKLRDDGRAASTSNESGPGTSSMTS
jgi:hypothetical protein